ncbi:MAG: nucleotidyltransferase domain-containing protein [Ignavibacteria bacterium]|nr:nucleotidyltransferase domain-containing protein [Ignavibacteria bacterium]
MIVQDISQLNTLAKPLFDQYNISKAAVFGSFAHGSAKKKSDIDLLIAFIGVYDLFDIIGLKQDLEEACGRKVDLLTYSSLTDNEFSKIILQEAKIIYEKN